MGFWPTYAMYKLVDVVSEVFERIEWIYRAANESISSAIGFRILKTTFTEAEQLHKQALTIRQGAGDESQILIAESLSNLASLYRRMSRYTEAEADYREGVRRARSIPNARRDSAERVLDHPTVSLNRPKSMIFNGVS